MANSPNVPQNMAPDDLLGASPEHAIELSEDALDAVAGGEPAAGGTLPNPMVTKDETLAKQKASHKAAQAVAAYIAG